MGKRTVIVRQGLIYKKRTQVLSAGRHVPRYRGRGMEFVGEVGGKKTAHRHVRRRYEERRREKVFRFRITRDDGVVIDHTLLGAGGILIRPASYYDAVVGTARGYDENHPEYWTQDGDVWTYRYDVNPDYVRTWSYNTKTQIWTVPFFKEDSEYASCKSFWISIQCKNSVQAQYVISVDSGHPEYIYKWADRGKLEDVIRAGFYEVRVPLFEEIYSTDEVRYTPPPDCPDPGHWWPADYCWEHKSCINTPVKKTITVRSSVHYKVRFIAGGTPCAAYYGNYKTGCYSNYCWWCQAHAFEHWYCKEIDDWLTATTSNGDSSFNIKDNPIDSEQLVTPPEYTIQEANHEMIFNYIGPNPWELTTSCAIEEAGDSQISFSLPFKFFSFSDYMDVNPDFI